MKRAVVLLTGSNEKDQVLFDSVPELYRKGFQIDFLYIHATIDLGYYIPSYVEYVGASRVTFQSFKEEYEGKLTTLLSRYEYKPNLIFEESVDYAETFADILRYYDLGVIHKNDMETTTKSILKMNQEPLLILDKIPLLDLKHPVVAFDDSRAVCKSIFEYCFLFHETTKKLELAAYESDVNAENMRIALSVKGIEMNYTFIERDIQARGQEFIDKLNEYDLCVMGMLSHSAIFENLFRHIGLTLIKYIQKPIFIG